MPAPHVESALLKDPLINQPCFRDRGQAYCFRVLGAPVGAQERLGAVSRSQAGQVYQPEMARLLGQKWIAR